MINDIIIQPRVATSCRTLSVKITDRCWTDLLQPLDGCACCTIPVQITIAHVPQRSGTKNEANNHMIISTLISTRLPRLDPISQHQVKFPRLSRAKLCGTGPKPHPAAYSVDSR